MQRRGGYREQRWKEKPNNDGFSGSPAMEGVSAAAAETVANRLNMLSITGNSTYYYDSAPGIQFGSVGTANYFPVYGQNATWKPRSYKEEEIGKAYFDHRAVQERVNGAQKVSLGKSNAASSNFSGVNMFEKFKVDNSTYSVAQIRATFYPKFENEKSDQEVTSHLFFVLSGPNDFLITMNILLMFWTPKFPTMLLFMAKTKRFMHLLIAYAI